MSHLEELSSWFRAQCDGDWEHGDGIKIRTLDNPGWEVDISLAGTSLEDIKYDAIKINRSAMDWAHCFVRNEMFCIRCGPENLEEGIGYFLALTRGTVPYPPSDSRA